MSTRKANPFTPDSPEWQLFANMESNELLAKSYAADMKKASENFDRAMLTASKYRDALEKLAPDAVAELTEAKDQ